LEQVSLSELLKSPYIAVISYPSVSLREARKRTKQMERMGVEAIVFEGKTKIGRLGVLGIGTVSIVVKAICAKREFALKLRRTDSNRESMKNEFEITSFVNRLGIGPRVYAFTNELLLMELIKGLTLEEVLLSIRGKGRKEKTRELIHSILNQCRKLDIVGVDHGELSNLRKHILIAEDRVVLLDFESASFGRKPKNVTSAAQYLLIGSSISERIRKILGIVDTERIKKTLRQYKERHDDYSYSKLLEEIGVSV
jgi:putative serine/threonine protein kinase